MEYGGLMYNMKLVGWEDPKRTGLGFEASLRSGFKFLTSCDYL